MDIITKDELVYRANEIAERIDQGELFIYPTDSIYGIGCNAQSKKAVDTIRDIKERKDKPLSIWAPSKEWIYQNCKITPEAREWLEELPGPYTLMLELRNKKAVAPNVSCGKNKIGVRIPKHWFSDFVAALGYPIITTAANKSGEDFMTSLEDLDIDIKSNVRFIVYEGEKKGRPSKIIHI